MIGINDQSDREYACVRQDLEVNSHVPTLADSDRNGSTDLVPAKQDRLDGAADVRHECVEPVLVVVGSPYRGREWTRWIRSVARAVLTEPPARSPSYRNNILAYRRRTRASYLLARAVSRR